MKCVFHYNGRETRCSFRRVLMPGKAEAVKSPEKPMSRQALSSPEEIESEESEIEEQPDKAAIIERLKAQGAQRVLPGSDPTPSASSVPAASASSAVESEGPEAESEQDSTHQAFLDKTQKQVDASNKPAWYDLPQKIDNARHGEWDL